MKRTLIVVVLMALVALLAACGNAAVEQAVQDAAPTLQAAAEQLAPTLEAAAPELAPTVEAVVEEVAPTVEAAATELATGDEEAAAEGSFLEQARAGAFEGTTVTILGTMVDEEAVKMEAAVAPFEEQTGIDVVYEGSKEFETQINVAVDAGAAPDIANISQCCAASSTSTATTWKTGSGPLTTWSSAPTATTPSKTCARGRTWLTPG